MKASLFFALLLLNIQLFGQGFEHNEIDIPVEGKTTKGILTMPDGDGPFPGVVIIAGSGPTDYDGNSGAIPGKNNSLKLLAEGLAKQGYASIRYNKRIFAGFSETDLSFDDFVTDAKTAYGILKNNSKVSFVGFAGHSQGSLVGMLATQQTDASFFISIAGPGLDFAAIISEQLKANPYNPKELVESAENIMAELKKGNTVEEVPQPLLSLFRPTVQGFIGSWMKYSPTEEIAKIKVPVFVVNGTTDLQVSEDNATRLLEATTATKNQLIIDGMNHILKDAPADRSGNFATYSNPELPLSIGLIEGIQAFIKSIPKQ